MRLTKHHGLGNDFLVLAVGGVAGPVEAVAWCDRRRGIGADGLLLRGPAVPGTDVTMILLNADGSRAEMSGNGIRCFAQAVAAERGLAPGTLTIATDAGVRTVEWWPTGDPATIMATVAMGPVRTIDAPAAWSALGCDPLRPVVHLSLGNPHTVVAVDDVRQVDLAALGAEVPDVNLEIVQAGPGTDAVTMRVHERGAGITQACGTGACAAAFAAAQWGLVDRGVSEIIVHMDGGSAKVRLDTPAGEVTLVGPATHIAAVDISRTDISHTDISH